MIFLWFNFIAVGPVGPGIPGQVATVMTMPVGSIYPPTEPPPPGDVMAVEQPIEFNPAQVVFTPLTHSELWRN